MLHLVSPFMRNRVTSTASVLPHQRDWWFDGVFANAAGLGKLPPELMDMIRLQLDSDDDDDDRLLHMSLEEARSHREMMTAERASNTSARMRCWIRMTLLGIRSTWTFHRPH